jgi:hypothetical protein
MSCDFVEVRDEEHKIPKKRKNQNQNRKENEINSKRLKDFDPSNCQAARVIKELFGKATLTDLSTLARVCISELNGLYLDRAAYRRKPVMLKWFDENLDVIEPFLRAHVVVESGNLTHGSKTAIQRFEEGDQDADS